MKLKRFILLLVVILVVSCKTTNQTNSESSVNKLALDPSITTGTLDNGLTYFVRENSKPENRVEFRLVVKAGSVLEYDNQKGLAHFVEHMAFNGTKNFPKDELVKYLESLGMGFGPEINAYTSFDRTVYMLSVPADDPMAIDNAFLILEDWAHQISLDTEEIEKERGVIVEEWRLGRGVRGRFFDRFYPALLEDSIYADRLPIGDVEVIKNCHPDRLREFYRDWYRPDLMSVAVVGEIDESFALEKINKHFSFKGPENPPKREYFSIPVENDFDIEIISDEEKTSTSILYYIKRDWEVIDNVDSYKNYITEILSVIMFNKRMEEIYTKEDSPFISASTGFGDLVYGLDANSFFVNVEKEMVLEALEELLTQVESVKKYGYSKAELERAKSLINMIMENRYNERDNKESSEFVEDIIQYITIGYVPLDSETDMNLVKDLANEISLNDVNSKAINSFSGMDRTLAIHSPAKEDKLPSMDDILNLFTSVSSKEIDEREEDEITRELFDLNIKRGKIVSEEKDDTSGVTTFKLENGISVYLKDTDFKADEILLSAFSYGGYSLIEDDELLSGAIATNLVNLSGLNGFSNIELGHLLTGKNVSLSPWISDNMEGFSGSSSVKDLETLFQLIHLYFNKPDFNEESYSVINKNVKNYLDNRENSPETIFNDRVEELLGDGHFRSKPFTTESLKDSDFNETKRIYQERFGNPEDFSFVFTGSIDIDTLKKYIETYIGSLNTGDNNEVAIDRGVRSPSGIVTDIVEKGIEEKSTVEILFNGGFDGNMEEHFIASMVDSYLDEALRVEIREELGGTYGVSVFSRFTYKPYGNYIFGLYFGCEPGREDELIEASFKVVNKLLDGDVDESIVDNVKANYLRSLELELKENNYWLDEIINSLILETPFKEIGKDISDLITGDNLVKVAKKYINFNRYVQVVLKPEN